MVTMTIAFVTMTDWNCSSSIHCLKFNFIQRNSIIVIAFSCLTWIVLNWVYLWRTYFCCFWSDCLFMLCTYTPDAILFIWMLYSSMIWVFLYFVYCRELLDNLLFAHSLLSPTGCLVGKWSVYNLVGWCRECHTILCLNCYTELYVTPLKKKKNTLSLSLSLSFQLIL